MVFIKLRFCKQIKKNPWFREKEITSGVSKTPKDFNKTIVFETTKFIVSKHNTSFENHGISSIH
jgi:hypothetical protein